MIQKSSWLRGGNWKIHKIHHLLRDTCIYFICIALHTQHAWFKVFHSTERKNKEEERTEIPNRNQLKHKSLCVCFQIVWTPVCICAWEIVNYYSALCCSLVSNNSATTGLAWEERFVELIWLLIFNHRWGHRRIWGSGSCRALTLIALVNLPFWGGTPCREDICASVWLHRRWSAPNVLLISHICSASALRQYAIRWSEGLPLPYAGGQSNHNLMIWSAWEWIRRAMFLLAPGQDEGLSQAECSPSCSLFTRCNRSQMIIQVLGRNLEGSCESF